MLFCFYLLDLNVCFNTNPPTQNFVHVLMWRMLLIVPLIINVVKLISFNSAHCTRQRVCLCQHMLFLCMNVRVFCTVVRKTVWTTGCQCDLWTISSLVLILKQGELSLALKPALSHLAMQSFSVMPQGLGWSRLVQKRMKSGQSQNRFWLPVFSAAIFRPAGYKAAGIGAPTNPSALSNFADSSCYAVQFSLHFYCCQTCDIWRAASALRNNNQRVFKSLKDVKKPRESLLLPSRFKCISDATLACCMYHVCMNV